MNALISPTGPATLSDDEFDRIAAIALKEAGLSIPGTKKSLVQSRISKRLRQLTIPSCDQYFAFLSDPPEEKRELISILTTNVSSFYRESHHFDFLRKAVLPSVLAKLEGGERVRFWSAGCSSGEEAYTLAIELLKAIPNAANLDILVLASDIDPRILSTARQGTYPAAALDSIAPEDRQRFFANSDEAPDRYTVSEELQRLIRFRELNLNGPWPMQNNFDVIFCRNVVIYFDDVRQQALWPRFRDMLSPDGRLFLGHSERIHPLAGSGFATEDVTVYQRT